MANSIKYCDKEKNDEVDECVQQLNASKVESVARKVEALEVVVAKGAGSSKVMK